MVNIGVFFLLVLYLFIFFLNVLINFKGVLIYNHKGLTLEYRRVNNVLACFNTSSLSGKGLMVRGH